MGQETLLKRNALLTSTSGMLNSCSWLMLFKVLPESSEILSLSLSSGIICCTTRSMDSVFVNYSWWKCLSVPEIYSTNKSSIISRTLSLHLNYTKSEDSNTIYKAKFNVEKANNEFYWRLFNYYCIA